MNALAAWESFYGVVGSAAGALIGLQFVVITLIAERPPVHAVEASRAFATPTIVHFGAALLLSALARVPWDGVMPVSAAWGLIGMGGVGYSFIVANRIRSQGAYRPDLEDWTFAYCCCRQRSCDLMLAKHCSAWGLRPCCCYSPAFITPGMPLSTMSWLAGQTPPQESHELITCLVTTIWANRRGLVTVIE
jgi:hypothetical protein